MTTQGDEAPPRTSSAADGAGPEGRGRRSRAGGVASSGSWAAPFRYTLPGAWVALGFACLAFTPSLLPRSALLRGVVCGISAAIGYGVGVAGAWMWRAFADRDPRRPGPGAWRVFVISAAVLLVVAVVVGQWWQVQLRELMGAAAPSVLLWPLLPLVAVVLSLG